MTPTIRHHATRVVLTLGLGAGVWGVAATTPGAQPVPPAAPDAAFAALVAAADVAAGQTASLACAGCHTLGEGEGTRFGPNLFGIVDRPVASVAGFAYSPAMAALGATGATWTADLLNAFLTSPQGAVAGTTMPFPGIPDEATRANLIGYLATLGGAGGGAAAAPTGTPVTFTQAQVDRGASRYERDCLECHGDTLNGGLIGGPPLRGLAFEAKYLNGAPASALFLFASTAMPPDNPGGYQASIYADLVAYILTFNGFTAGDTPLPADAEALNALTMTH